MAACPNSRPQNRKRQHAEADLSQDDLPLLPPKKFKSTTERHSAANFTPAFYDSLSKVWLTRRALRELDRRNQLKSSVCARALPHSPVRRFSKRIDLQRFARLGGPELGDLRGYLGPTEVNPAYIMSSRRSNNSSRSSHTKRSKSTSNPTPETSNTEGSRRRSSAYNADFEQHLIDNGIYPKGYEYPDDRETPEPSNLEDIRRRINQPRPSLSPSRFSNSAFREFVRANDRVIKEGDVMRAVLPIMYGEADIPNQEDLLFTRLESITNEATVDAKPDFYDGVRLESIDKQVQQDLGPYIIPTGHRTAPVAPNFFIEAKAPKGGADVVKRQVTHDLSLGARGMHKLQSYGTEEPVFDNKAYTLGATYHNGQLLMYTTHITPSGPGGSPEYHMTQLGGWTTTGDPDTCRRGAAALRHGREVTMEWRDELISAVNERATHFNAQPSASASFNGISDTTEAYPVGESQTSVDEIATTSFYPVDESDCNHLSNVVKDSETSFDEHVLGTLVKAAPSKKRLSKGPEKTVSKAPRQGTGTCHQKHRSKR